LQGPSKLIDEVYSKLTVSGLDYKLTVSGLRRGSGVRVVRNVRDIPGIMEVPIHELRERMVVSSIPAPSYKPITRMTTSRKQRLPVPEVGEASKERELAIEGQWVQLPGSETESLAVSIVRAVTSVHGASRRMNSGRYPLIRVLADVVSRRSSRRGPAKSGKYMSIQWSDYFSKKPVREEEFCGSYVDASALAKINKTVMKWLNRKPDNRKMEKVI